MFVTLGTAMTGVGAYLVGGYSAALLASGACVFLAGCFDYLKKP